MNKTMKYKLKLDYTADELKELKELGKTCDSPMSAIEEIVLVTRGDDQCSNLREKYFATRPADEFNFMADINNVVMGTAIFPEKKYVVHDKVTDQYICYCLNENGFAWGYLESDAVTHVKGKWLAINPAYEPMLERAED